MSNVELPCDIIENILSRLPVKSLGQFRCVAKEWCILLKNPVFIKMHLIRSKENKSNLELVVENFAHRSLILKDNLGMGRVTHPLKILVCNEEILGSCNGLLCITPDHMLTIFLWNPSTRQYKNLPNNIPPSYRIMGMQMCKTVYGFGYNSTSGDYELVQIVSFNKEYGDFSGSMVKVYSLSNDSWRRIQNIPYKIVQAKPGELVCGALHWVALATHCIIPKSCVIAFNLENEKFQEVPLPEYEKENFYRMTISVLNEDLCMVCHYSTHVEGLEAWVMKDYGVRESWTKLFKIEEQYVPMLEPLLSAENNAIILLNCNKEIVMYDPKDKRLRTLLEQDDPKIFIYAKTYAESLVSLSDIVNNETVAEIRDMANWKGRGRVITNGNAVKN